MVIQSEKKSQRVKRGPAPLFRRRRTRSGKARAQSVATSTASCINDANSHIRRASLRSNRHTKPDVRNS
jgi:hypothetical protein